MAYAVGKKEEKTAIVTLIEKTDKAICKKKRPTKGIFLKSRIRLQSAIMKAQTKHITVEVRLILVILCTELINKQTINQMMVKMAQEGYRILLKMKETVFIILLFCADIFIIITQTGMLFQVLFLFFDNSSEK